MIWSTKKFTKQSPKWSYFHVHCCTCRYSVLPPGCSSSRGLEQETVIYAASVTYLHTSVTDVVTDDVFCLFLSVCLFKKWCMMWPHPEVKAQLRQSLNWEKWWAQKCHRFTTALCYVTLATRGSLTGGMWVCLCAKDIRASVERQGHWHLTCMNIVTRRQLRQLWDWFTPLWGAVLEWLLTEHLFTGTHITMYMHIPHKPLKWLNTEYLPNFTFNLCLYFGSDLTVSVGKYFVYNFMQIWCWCTRLSHTRVTANGSLSFYLSFLMEKRHLTIASFGAS